MEHISDTEMCEEFDLGVSEDLHISELDIPTINIGDLVLSSQYDKYQDIELPDITAPVIEEKFSRSYLNSAITNKERCLKPSGSSLHDPSEDKCTDILHLKQFKSPTSNCSNTIYQMPEKNNNKHDIKHVRSPGNSKDILNNNPRMDTSPMKLTRQSQKDLNLLIATSIIEAQHSLQTNGEASYSQGRIEDKYSHLIRPCSVILREISHLVDQSSSIIILDEDSNTDKIMELNDTVSDDVCKPINISFDEENEFKDNIFEGFPIQNDTKMSRFKHVKQVIEKCKMSPIKLAGGIYVSMPKKRKSHSGNNSISKKCNFTGFNSNINTVSSEDNHMSSEDSDRIRDEISLQKCPTIIQQWSGELSKLEEQNTGNSFLRQINLLKRLDILLQYQNWSDSQVHHSTKVNHCEFQKSTLFNIQDRILAIKIASLQNCNLDDNKIEVDSNNHKNVKKNIKDEDDLLVENCGTWCDGLENYDLQDDEGTTTTSSNDHSNTSKISVQAENFPETNIVPDVSHSSTDSVSDKLTGPNNVTADLFNTNNTNHSLDHSSEMSNNTLSEPDGSRSIFVCKTEYGEIACNIELGLYPSLQESTEHKDNSSDQIVYVENNIKSGEMKRKRSNLTVVTSDRPHYKFSDFDDISSSSADSAYSANDISQVNSNSSLYCSETFDLNGKSSSSSAMESTLQFSDNDKNASPLTSDNNFTSDAVPPRKIFVVDANKVSLKSPNNFESAHTEMLLNNTFEPNPNCSKNLLQDHIPSVVKSIEHTNVSITDKDPSADTTKAATIATTIDTNTRALVKIHNINRQESDSSKNSDTDFEGFSNTKIEFDVTTTSVESRHSQHPSGLQMVGPATSLNENCDKTKRPSVNKYASAICGSRSFYHLETSIGINNPLLMLHCKSCNFMIPFSAAYMSEIVDHFLSPQRFYKQVSKNLLLDSFTQHVRLGIDSASSSTKVSISNGIKCKKCQTSVLLKLDDCSNIVKHYHACGVEGNPRANTNTTNSNNVTSTTTSNSNSSNVTSTITSNSKVTTTTSNINNTSCHFRHTNLEYDDDHVNSCDQLSLSVMQRSPIACKHLTQALRPTCCVCGCRRWSYVGQSRSLPPVCIGCRDMLLQASATLESRIFGTCCTCLTECSSKYYIYPITSFMKVCVGWNCLEILREENDRYAAKKIANERIRISYLLNCVMEQISKEKIENNSNIESPAESKMLGILQDALKEKIKNNIYRQTLGEKAIAVTPDNLLQNFKLNKNYAFADDRAVGVLNEVEKVLNTSIKRIVIKKPLHNHLAKQQPPSAFPPNPPSPKSCKLTPLTGGKNSLVTTTREPSQAPSGQLLNESHTANGIALAYATLTQCKALTLSQLFPSLHLKTKTFFDMSGTCRSCYEISAKTLINNPVMRHFATLRIPKEKRKHMAFVFLKSLDPNTEYMVSAKPFRADSLTYKNVPITEYSARNAKGSRDTNPLIFNSSSDNSTLVNQPFDKSVHNHLSEYPNIVRKDKASSKIIPLVVKVNRSILNNTPVATYQNVQKQYCQQVTNLSDVKDDVACQIVEAEQSSKCSHDSSKNEIVESVLTSTSSRSDKSVVISSVSTLICSQSLLCNKTKAEKLLYNPIPSALSANKKEYSHLNGDICKQSGYVLHKHPSLIVNESAISNTSHNSSSDSLNSLNSSCKTVVNVVAIKPFPNMRHGKEVLPDHVSSYSKDTSLLSSSSNPDTSAKQILNYDRKSILAIPRSQYEIKGKNGSILVYDCKLNLPPCDTTNASPTVTVSTSATVTANASTTVITNASATVTPNTNAAVTANTSVSDTANTSVSDTANTSVSDTADTSATDTANNSATDTRPTNTANTSVTYTANNSVTDTANTSPTVKNNTSVTDTANTSTSNTENTNPTVTANTSSIDTAITTTSRPANTSSTDSANTSHTDAANTSYTITDNTSDTDTANTEVIDTANTRVTDTASTSVTVTANSSPAVDDTSCGVDANTTNCAVSTPASMSPSTVLRRIAAAKEGKLLDAPGSSSLAESDLEGEIVRCQSKNDLQSKILCTRNTNELAVTISSCDTGGGKYLKIRTSVDDENSSSSSTSHSVDSSMGDRDRQISDDMNCFDRNDMDYDNEECSPVNMSIEDLIDQELVQWQVEDAIESIAPKRSANCLEDRNFGNSPKKNNIFSN